MRHLRLRARLPGLFALGAAVLLPACEVPRPQGFTPGSRVVGVGNMDVFLEGDASAGAHQGPPDVLGEGADGGAVVAPDSPLGRVEGYYYLRTDIEFTYAQTETGQTLAVFTRVSHVGLTRLVAHGEGLNAVERTCHIFYQHECRQNCDHFTTSIAPRAVDLVRAQDLRRRYSLTHGGTQFVTDATDLLLGFTGPPDPLPDSLSDPSLWDADMNSATRGLYVYVHTDGLPLNPFNPSSRSLDCYYNTVERFTSSYGGALRDGSLDGVNAALNTTGSHARTLQHAGGGLCSPSNTNPPASRTTVRFARVVPPDADAFWTCPDREAFRTELPDP